MACMAAYQFGSSASITMMNAEVVAISGNKRPVELDRKNRANCKTNSNKKDLSTVELGISHNLLLSDF